MKLMINHQTHYQYSEIASGSIQYIKMNPQDQVQQRVQHWEISVPGQRQISRDVFHNIWITCRQDFEYQQLTIMAQGVVEINPDYAYGIQLDLPVMLFLQTTLTTQCSAEMLAFAQRAVAYASQAQIKVAHLQDLAAAVLQQMPYISASTLVSYTAIESFTAQQGVCQDHSHVFIAMCRGLGIPARYVSGYLYAENSSHLASHAWAEAYIAGHWYCFDVSNQLFRPCAHIYVAVGRDYWDVAPVRGVRDRGGVESMYSSVQVLAC